MKRLTIKTEKREVVGRKVKKLRKEGILPVNLYGSKIKSQSLQVKTDEFRKIWEQVGETTLLDLEVGEKVHPVMIHHVQIHPVSDEFIHVDFHEVSLTEKTTAKIPVELIGESSAVKQGLGVLLHTLSEIEVEALPADFPEKLTVDISGLTEVNNQVTVADIKTDPKVKILVEATELVAKIGALQKEEVIAPAPVEVVVAEGVPAEGEVAAGTDQETQPKDNPTEKKKE